MEEDHLMTAGRTVYSGRVNKGYFIMKIKKFLQIFYIFYIASFCEPVFAQAERCFFEPYSDGIEVVHIGDRQVYTLFTSHPTEREGNAVFNALDNFQNSIFPPTIARNIFDRAIEPYREFIELEQANISKN